MAWQRAVSCSSHTESLVLQQKGHWPAACWNHQGTPYRLQASQMLIVFWGIIPSTCSRCISTNKSWHHEINWQSTQSTFLMSKAGKTVIQGPEFAASEIWVSQCHTTHAKGLSQETSPSLAFIMSSHLTIVVMIWSFRSLYSLEPTKLKITPISWSWLSDHATITVKNCFIVFIITGTIPADLQIWYNLTKATRNAGLLTL